jgi:hypothetical protein
MSEHDIARWYFEHVAEYSVAARRECRYAVWPDQIESHLQEQHKISHKEAEAVTVLGQKYPNANVSVAATSRSDQRATEHQNTRHASKFNAQ